MKHGSVKLYLVVLEVHSTFLASGLLDRLLHVRRFALLICSFAPPPVLAFTHAPLCLFTRLSWPFACLRRPFESSLVPPYTRTAVLPFGRTTVCPNRWNVDPEDGRNGRRPNCEATRMPNRKMAKPGGDRMTKRLAAQLTSPCFRPFVRSLVRLSGRPLV